MVDRDGRAVLIMNWGMHSPNVQGPRICSKHSVHWRDSLHSNDATLKMANTSA